jgi:hypothetical protein
MLTKYAMRSILEYLDDALAETRRTDGRIEGHATWNIRMARKRLLEAAVTDVAVEAPTPFVKLVPGCPVTTLETV